MVYAASAATDFDGLHGGETAVNASKVFWRGVVCALAGATLWGFSGACIQFLAESYEVSSAFISAVRAGVAALLFAVFVFVTRREALLSLLGSPAARPTLVLFGVGLYLSQITYAVSVALTNAGTATVLQATCTVFVMLITCARAAPSAARRRLCRADVRDGRRDAHRHPGRLGRHRAAGGGLGLGHCQRLVRDALHHGAPTALRPMGSPHRHRLRDGH